MVKVWHQHLCTTDILYATTFSGGQKSGRPAVLDLTGQAAVFGENPLFIRAG